MWAAILVNVLVAYMLGNLNGAVCISALLHDDVRSHGSGNAGLTNFIRNYGVSHAVRVILIDAGKAVLACVMGGMLLKPYDNFLLGAILAAGWYIVAFVMDDKLKSAEDIQRCADMPVLAIVPKNPGSSHQ